MLDLDANEKKVDFAYNDVLQMVSAIISVSSYSAVLNWDSTHLLLLYSNSICRQSSIPTSILIELLLSGGMRYECTHMSFSFATSAIRLETDTRMKYLDRRDCFSSDSVKES